MHARSATPSSAEIAGEANTLVAGLGIFTLTFLPLAVPGLVLVVAPLALLAAAGLVLAIPLVLPIWLARVIWTRTRVRRTTAEPAPPRVRRSPALPSEPESTQAMVRTHRPVKSG